VEKDRHWAVTLIGVISALLLCAGVLRHYWDIYIHRTVRGISFIFVGIDTAGDVFSLVSVCKFPIQEAHGILSDVTVFQPKLDTLGMVIYASEFVLWSGVFACGGYFNFAPWVRQKLRTRAQQKETQRSEEMRRDGEELGNGASNGISLHRMPSSTSVFRTPSSVVVSRGSVVSLERGGG
jgi:hypothetical protein